jgi:hypothetical protein
MAMTSRIDNNDRIGIDEQGVVFECHHEYHGWYQLHEIVHFDSMDSALIPQYSNKFHRHMWGYYQFIPSYMAVFQTMILAQKI